MLSTPLETKHTVGATLVVARPANPGRRPPASGRPQGSPLRRIAVLATILCGLGAANSAPATFYVAAGGSDANPGTAAQPLASLERARDAVRALKQAGPLPAGGATVRVRPGLYPVTRTLSLDAQDAGTADAPVVYRADGPQPTVLIGGRAITGWRVYQGTILQAEVGAQGFQGVYFRQLLCNGQRMQLARYPDYDAEDPVTGGWAYAEGKPVPMYQDVPGEPQNELRCKPADQREWAKPEEGEVFVFPRYNWWNNLLPIAAVDREQHVLKLGGNASYAIRPGDRYFARNRPEELDAPWYLDKTTWTLYFIPPKGVDPATMTVCAPLVRTILDLRAGAADTTFQGFVVECCQGSAITLTGATDCRIAGCTIRNVGDYFGSGVAVSGGTHNGVVGCDIHDTGRDAVSLDGGDFNTLEPAGNYADNNYLHHFGVFYKQGVGVALSGVGNRVSHNLIHDGPRFGIVWGGNDHVMEYNEIRHVDLETADCGAIYSWQVDWSKRGTEIRYNYLHDIIGFGWEGGRWTSPHFNWGIYLDDGTCGTHVHGNLVVRTILGGCHVHGGRDNVIENNVFIDGRDSQMQYSGYVAGGHPVPMMTDTWNKFHGTPAYDKYPGYVALTRSLADAWQMAGNRFLRNIVCYREPRAVLFAHYNLPFDKTESDRNLIWHDGAPLLTGVQAVKAVTGPNLAPNPGFEEGEPGQLPTGWTWGVRPNDSSAAVDPAQHVSGEQSVRIDGKGTTTDSSGQTLVSNFDSERITLKPGHTYRLSASVRAAADTRFAVMAECYVPAKAFWARPVAGTAAAEWKRVEVTFRFPAEGDAGWHDGMTFIRIRIDVSQGTGTLWVDDVELREAEVLTEWEAWQAQGLDQHSVIADPQFVDRAGGDYRLRPGSPALALGFQPLPLAKIGPYRDDLRASWPIVEARGAREQMTLDWSKH
ncbi:MAG: right-handed parallel beta-helix repeat-containing protein [Armatimonadetes bacterium]|nr:right-handed parallel beta-helix repeat-containing protein [Armatimonadota bacterium]